MVAVNSATLKQLQQQEDISSVIVQAATLSEPFAKLIQQIRLRERPVYRFNPQNGRIEVVTDGLSEADTEMIETCEKHIEEIHASAWKQYRALQPAEPLAESIKPEVSDGDRRSRRSLFRDRQTAQASEPKVCEDEPSSHAAWLHPKPSPFIKTTTPRGFQKLSFRDHDGGECSLQQSSAADNTERGMNNPGTSFVWLGYNHGGHQRMHLSREQAEFLAYHLCRWIDTGKFD